MRTALDHLETPYPLADQLPAVLVGDQVARGITAGIDQVLAPVYTALACFADYLDPELAPTDFLGWLAGWLAVDLDSCQDVDQQRRLVAQAMEVHRWLGTRRGLLGYLRILISGAVDVIDSGGCVVTTRAGTGFPSRGPATVTVRIPPNQDTGMVSPRVRDLIAQVVPAHVTVAVEVIR